jgi:hypothetical protein
MAVMYLSPAGTCTSVGLAIVSVSNSSNVPVAESPAARVFPDRSSVATKVRFAYSSGRTSTFAPVPRSIAIRCALAPTPA